MSTDMREAKEARGPQSAVRRARRLAAPASAAVAFLALALADLGAARAEEVRAELSAAVGNGHGRLIFTFSEEIATDAHVSNGILIIGFGRPVAIAIDRLERRLPGYVQAARRDPDGSAVRLSLASRVRVNIMEAGEKLFVDLLPPGWSGLPPGLPQEVVDELARRAREAERRARLKHMALPGGALSPVRLRVSQAPTFARFAFEMAEPIPVELKRDGQELQVRFEAPVKIDLGEAKAQLPAGIVGLDLAFEEDRSTVKLVLAPNASMREFREGNAVLVDVTPLSWGMAAPDLAGLAAEAQAEAERRAALAAAGAADARTPTKWMPPLAAGAGDHGRPAPLDFSTGPEGFAHGPVRPIVARQSGQFRIAFPFAEPTPAAVFMRGEHLWIVFDTPRRIDVAPLNADPTRSVIAAEFRHSEFGAIVRLKLARTRLPSVERDGATWMLTLADGVAAPSRPLPLRRAPGADELAAVLVPLEAPGQIHRIVDPEIGDTLFVVTAEPPARGVLRGQNFVEFQALASIHGLALAALADDVTVRLTVDGVTIRRPAGLLVSDLPAPPPPPKPIAKRRVTPLDVELWKAERDSPFYRREAELVQSVSASPPGLRADARIMHARFYLAHEFAAEAKGVLEAGVREGKELLNRPLYHLLRGIAELQLGRPEEALRLFTHPSLNDVAEAALLRTVANAALGRWTPARDALRFGAHAFDDLPAMFQQRVLLAALRAAIEVRDFVEASRLLHELEVMALPAAVKPELVMLAGRVAEGVGRFERAKALYESVAETDAGPAAAEAKLRSIAMRHARGELDRTKAIDRLETLAISWRGDRIELETVRLLGRLYVEEARYRDAFKLLDTAARIDAEGEISHTFHAETAAVFEDLYLTGKSATLPPVEALALYYDFSRLTPIGRRGDELIRRLADRLVAVDLLEQAAELLDHQVEYRLSGVAKAQVAVKLAEIHLMNRKPAEAVRVLAATRMPSLPQELRDQRMFIEARALSDAGRPETALELIQNLKGPEVDRLRADIAWVAKQWREAGERIEKLLGDRWQGDSPLTDAERHDVLRAALAYALGQERIGLARINEKFAEKMGETPEGEILKLVASPMGTSASTLAEAAKALARFDNLGSFLKLYRARYPERPLPPDPAPTSGMAERRAGR